MMPEEEEEHEQEEQEHEEKRLYFVTFEMIKYTQK